VGPRLVDVLIELRFECPRIMRKIEGKLELWLPSRFLYAFGYETSRGRQRAFHRKGFSNSDRYLICFVFASHYILVFVCVEVDRPKPPMSRQHSVGPSPKLLSRRHIKVR
jgi:hypothetical protein